MSDNLKSFLYQLSAFLIMLTLISQLQSVLLFHWARAISFVPFWLLLFSYNFLNRTEKVNVVCLLFASIFMTSLSSEKWHLFWIKILTTYLLLNEVRKRTYWSGFFYYLRFAIGTSVVFFVINSLVDVLFVHQTFNLLRPDYLLSLVLLTLFSLPFYVLFKKIDSIFKLKMTFAGEGREQ
jgi:hypothetical protein